MHAPKITNRTVYNAEMTKPMDDKLFFMTENNGKYLKDIDTLVDFGCADGMLFHSLIDSFPNARMIKLIGVDNEEKAVEEAKNTLKGHKNCHIIKGDSITKISTKFNPENSALNLSSVIHEIYSYQSEKYIKNFWENINKSGFKYIFIRDMVCNLPEGELLEEGHSDVKKVRDNPSYTKKLKDFENIWGGISVRKNLYHFLLKYRYNLNWKREVRENYLPLSGNEIIAKFMDNYDILYVNQYTLPFIQNEIKREFDIDISEPTHIKLILKRKQVL